LEEAIKITYAPEVDILRIIFSNAPIAEKANGLIVFLWSSEIGLVLRAVGDLFGFD
jgi:hypothetical protein